MAKQTASLTAERRRRPLEDWIHEFRHGVIRVDENGDEVEEGGERVCDIPTVADFTGKSVSTIKQKIKAVVAEVDSQGYNGMEKLLAAVGAVRFVEDQKKRRRRRRSRSNPLFALEMMAQDVEELVGA